MKILVIPDVHLKPWMFEQAARLMKTEKIDKAVCLMDIADDWKEQLNLGLYIKSYQAAADFAMEFPETLWCWGNHDISYVWQRMQSGYSNWAVNVVLDGLGKLKAAIPDPGQLAFIHRIDNVLFMHGGLTEPFAREYAASADFDDIDGIIEEINSLGPDELWQNTSPLWLRPQYRAVLMYKADEYLQVVGHTPVERIIYKNNLISCDVFSLTREKVPFGTQEFPVLDTETWECYGVR